MNKHFFRAMAVAALFPIVLTGCIQNGDGEKPGIITKLSKQGVLCPTWEAELIRGGLNGGSGAMGKPFDFTVSDDAMRQKVQEALETGAEVKIHYVSEMVTFCSTESNNFLTSIEVLGQGTHTGGNVQVVNDGVRGVAGRNHQQKVLELLNVQAQLMANQASILKELNDEVNHQ